MIGISIFNKDKERVPKPFDFIGILADRYNCSYVLGQTQNVFEVVSDIIPKSKKKSRCEFYRESFRVL
ncbi:hypothetical protein IQB76_01175 [Leptospira borgpetersenii serovar Hardjo-bovis]|uniref:Uncharacterized protein n=1 Tax=Leptospira borgpetersenii serovar Hardjo-bovis str. Sponselee TaxID=1303729 RepID=M6C491_LEPBO|nr:hypothetical protein LBK6_14070 [Leptospira borgpetersenii serovar Hardjo]EMJ83613.1 hypothetical protein LEP1GSC016_0217 [Leptospira borgpetersenii serovar Hardjo-bovis str. Sponselee]MBE8349735.1 hypothetical protein [Leptospira borgpetersenii serovar Hardjo-bovis]TQE55028.1 hypothetical protein FFZ95_01360 [Leptospira borgpetersenii]AMX62636.1 hypothetical protein LBK9_13990 [Leptospira borgpetersenii serovar Hardjo]